MLKYLKSLFKYEDVLEQRRAGEWKKIRRYKHINGILLSLGGLLVFIVMLIIFLWFLLQEKIITLPFLSPHEPAVSSDAAVKTQPAAPKPIEPPKPLEIPKSVEPPKPAESVAPAVSADAVSEGAFEPIMLDETDGAFASDVVRFAPRAERAKQLTNEIWILIKKGEGKLYLYEKMLEGNKEIGDWLIFTNGNDIPAGTLSVRMVHDTQKWTHDFGEGLEKGAYGRWFLRLGKIDGIALGVHGTLNDTTDRRVSIGIQMKNSDLEELEKLVMPKMRVVVEE